MIRICLLLLLLVISAPRADAAISTETMNDTDVSGTYVLRVPSGRPKLYLRDIPDTSISITANPFGASYTAADNTSAIQSAINAAVAAGVPLRIPAAPSCYKYTAPLTINGNLTIIGDSLVGNWANNINVPAGNPPLFGSVLCPTSNGSDAIDISGTSLTVNIQNLGIVFQTYFSGTGDGINYVATATQGLSSSLWNNVIVYGNDANHWGVNLGNFIYDTFNAVLVYGGGGWNLAGNGISGNYGNSEFYALQAWTLSGGTNGGVAIAATALNNLNLLTFYSPQVMLVNQIGVTPVANPPTNAQLEWSIDTNTTNVWMVAPDTSGNIVGRTSLLAQLRNNVFDFAHGYWDSVITSPSWTLNGIAPSSGNPVTVQDTTATGTVSIESAVAFPTVHINASNAVTFTHMPTLYVPPPIGGTNVTATSTEAIYAAGQIFSTSSITAQSGIFATGNSQINHNSSGTTAIGDGTTTGTVTIGGASNIVNIAGGTIQAGGTAGVTCTAGTVNATTMTVKNGIVTHC